MQIRELRNESELEVGYSVLNELRTNLSREEFYSIYKAARAADGYQLLGAFDSDRCIGVMGLRVLHDYVHGRHIYIDDLVVTESSRSQGLGAKLLKHAETLVSEYNCRGLRLSTGLANEKAMRFYEREGWALKSVTFKKFT